MLFSQWTSSTIILYMWHLTNSLTHLLFESTYVYGCFKYSIPVPTPTPPHHISSPSLDYFTPRFFLGRKDRLYGNAYGTNIVAKIWQEYARADSRYAGIDIMTLSLEIITVFLAGPLSLYVAESIRMDIGKEGRLAGRTWFCAGILAVSELYGGLLNFLPEWLTINSSLRTDNALYFWVYIVFFNAIWIVFPLWVLGQVYSEFASAFEAKARSDRTQRRVATSAETIKTQSGVNSKR